MKILLISNMYPSPEFPFYGIFVRNFESMLQSKGLDISKVVIIGRGVSIRSKIRKYITFYSTVLHTLWKNEYELVYIHYPTYSILPVLFLRWRIKGKLILNFHGGDLMPRSQLARYLLKFSKPIIKNADLLVVPSEFFQNVLYKTLGCPKEKIFISPSGGIDTNLFKSGSELKDKTKFVIGYVSRIDEGKGWNTLLQALPSIRDHIPNLKCIIAGSGSQVDAMYEQIQDLALQDIVEYRGAIPHEILSHFYNLLDVFVFPTELPESLGLVGLEAMSCGIPVIGSKIGGLQDYIIDGQNGYLFTPGNVEDLKEKILLFANNREKFSNVRDTVLKYDSKIVAQKMVSKLHEVANQQ